MMEANPQLLVLAPPSRDTATTQYIQDGGHLPFSPLSFLQPNESAKYGGAPRGRELSSDDESMSYLVDEDGQEYEPYALAWRYLGLHIDCGEEQNDDDSYNDDNDDNNRHLNDEGGGNGDCQRVLLWAAYFNPHYRGNSIGEYQFYNLTSMQYDKSNCRTRRCTRLDCHETFSNFKLVGIFKETDGLTDWTEQLFKHEASCLWDESVYETMQETIDTLPSSCDKLEYFVDMYGNSLYLDLKPEKYGNVGVGVYIDEQCTQESGIVYADYLVAYYENYYYSADMGYQAAAKWITTMQEWNDNMDLYKICQPCRAYSFTSQSSNGNNHRRLNNNDDNDGEGGEEKFGFNCYDDAGYTNVNQCYKFEVKTDMEPVSEYDLKMASDTILRVSYKGKLYGHGGHHSTPEIFSLEGLLLMGIAIASLLALVVLKIHCKRKNRKVADALSKQIAEENNAKPTQTFVAERSAISSASTESSAEDRVENAKEDFSDMYAICCANTEDLDENLSGYLSMDQSTDYATSRSYDTAPHSHGMISMSFNTTQEESAITVDGQSLNELPVATQTISGVQSDLGSLEPSVQEQCVHETSTCVTTRKSNVYSKTVPASENAMDGNKLDAAVVEAEASEVRLGTSHVSAVSKSPVPVVPKSPVPAVSKSPVPTVSKPEPSAKKDGDTMGTTSNSHRSSSPSLPPLFMKSLRSRWKYRKSHGQKQKTEALLESTKGDTLSEQRNETADNHSRTDTLTEYN